MPRLLHAIDHSSNKGGAELRLVLRDILSEERIFLGFHLFFFFHGLFKGYSKDLMDLTGFGGI